jgi:hypothetical protein
MTEDIYFKLTSQDFPTVMEIMRNIVNQKRENSKVTYHNLHNLSGGQRLVIDKFKNAYGEDKYLNELNKIMNDYLTFKGGNNNISSVPKKPTSSAEVRETIKTVAQAVGTTAKTIGDVISRYKQNKQPIHVTTEDIKKACEFCKKYSPQNNPQKGGQQQCQNCYKMKELNCTCNANAKLKIPTISSEEISKNFIPIPLESIDINPQKPPTKESEEMKTNVAEVNIQVGSGLPELIYTNSIYTISEEIETSMY